MMLLPIRRFAIAQGVLASSSPEESFRWMVRQMTAGIGAAKE